MQRCKGKTKGGKPCRNWAMHNGCCRMHGGKSLKGAESPTFKHGRYSQYAAPTLQAKISAFSEGDPLSLADELATQRALMAEYLERFTPAQGGSNMKAADIGMIMSWLDTIGRMVERIIKTRNDTALTAAEVQYLTLRMVELIGKYVTDADAKRAFVEELFSVVESRDVVSIGSGNTEL